MKKLLPVLIGLLIVHGSCTKDKSCNLPVGNTIAERQQSGDFNAEDKAMVKSLEKQIESARAFLKELGVDE